MKRLILTLLGFCLAASLPAQGPADSPPTPRRTAAELDELLGPIALYPDALIAIILPASTYPSDIVLAARYLAAGGNPARVEEKSWDSSVKALTRYPDTLRWLDENLDWTDQVGDAFIEQPVEVMESIQQLRARARAMGNLVDTPEQRIVQDDANIRIIPAQPNYIFEPRYDPDVIYYERPVAGPLLFFSIGYGIGSWLNYDFDWHRHRLCRGDWHEGWDYHHDRNRRDQENYYYINNNLTNGREWHPDTKRHHAQSHQFSERSSNVGNSPGRASSRDTAPSRDSVAGDKREHQTGVAHPKAIAGAPHRGETIRRAERGDEGKGGKGPSTQTLHDNKPGEGSKGRVSLPKSDAPGVPGGGQKGNDARDRGDHKKSVNEPDGVNRRVDMPPKKETEARSHVETPKPQKTDMERRKSDNPPRSGEPKHKEAPKKEDAPKRGESVKREEPKHHDAPKHAEVAKHEAPKREAEKPREEPAKKKGKPDKKKDDDKDKKKEP
jgi:hypothetical protein